MPRILILYAPLGSGHSSAAKALEQAFSQFPNVEVQIEDALAHASPLMRSTITGLYKQLSENLPRLYRLIYEGSDIEDPEDYLSENRVFGAMERPFLKQLEDLVTDPGLDAIISVQQIPSRLLQMLELEGKLPHPHYVVITDVIAHSTWINYGVDGYFVPSPLTADLLMKRGVNPALLRITGIPIAVEIAQPKDKQEMRLQHDLPINAPVVTLFGSGIHPRRVRLMVEKILEGTSPGVLIVVAGRNEELMEALVELTDGPHMRLRRLGFIDFVDDLVAASDLVITKAGGLIVSEVLARGTPMVLIDPFPGQEEWNADAVSAFGAGIQLRLPEMVPPAVFHLLNQPDQLAFMRERARETGQPKAAFSIAEHVLADLKTFPR